MPLAFKQVAFRTACQHVCNGQLAFERDGLETMCEFEAHELEALCRLECKDKVRMPWQSLHSDVSVPVSFMWNAKSLSGIIRSYPEYWSLTWNCNKYNNSNQEIEHIMQLCAVLLVLLYLSFMRYVRIACSSWIPYISSYVHVLFVLNYDFLLASGGESRKLWFVRSWKQITHIRNVHTQASAFSFPMS